MLARRRRRRVLLCETRAGCEGSSSLSGARNMLSWGQGLAVALMQITGNLMTIEEQYPLITHLLISIFTRRMCKVRRCVSDAR